MTPKEKAEKLIFEFEKWTDSADEHGFAIECALIAVDEMIVQNGDIYLAMLGDKANEYYVRMNSYLFEVKQELENLK